MLHPLGKCCTRWQNVAPRGKRMARAAGVCRFVLPHVEIYADGPVRAAWCWGGCGESRGRSRGGSCRLSMCVAYNISPANARVCFSGRLRCHQAMAPQYVVGHRDVDRRQWGLRMSAVGILIRMYRERHAWTQRDLAQHAWNHAGPGALRSIDRLEKGLTPSDERIERLVQFLGVPADEFSQAQHADERERATAALQAASQRCDPVLTLRAAPAVYFSEPVPQHLSEDALVALACERARHWNFAAHLLLPSGVGVWITREGVVTHRTERTDEGGPARVQLRHDGRSFPPSGPKTTT